jgi:hypothetical protein
MIGWRQGYCLDCPCQAGGFATNPLSTCYTRFAGRVAGCLALTRDPIASVPETVGRMGRFGGPRFAWLSEVGTARPCFPKAAISIVELRASVTP